MKPLHEIYAIHLIFSELHMVRSSCVDHVSQVDGSKTCYHQILISSRSTEGACIILILLFVTRNLPLRALGRMSLSFLSANQFDTRSLSLSVSLSCRRLSLSLIAVPFPIPPWRDLSYFLSLFPSCGNPILNLGPPSASAAVRLLLVTISTLSRSVLHSTTTRGPRTASRIRHALHS